MQMRMTGNRRDHWADSRDAVVVRPLRILIVVPSKLGGTVQYSHNLANALADRGHRVLLATSLEYEMAGFERRYRTVEVFDRFRPHPGPIRRFISAVSELRPDIVHFQGAQRPEFYLLLHLLLRLKTAAQFVWTPQDVLSNSHKVWHGRMLRHLYGKMGYVFLNARQNEAVVTDLFGVAPDRIAVLPIPEYLSFVRTDLARAMPPELHLDPDRPMILCFGLIEERKGVDTLIRAFARLRRDGRDATLLVIGKQLMDITPLQRLIRDLELEQEVQIIGRYASFEEMNGLFEAAHHVAMAYTTGWNSGVLTTAFGYGKPVIASNVGGFDELVRDGQSGLLVPARDDDALAQAMGRMLTDEDAYANMCLGARQASLRCSWPELAKTTEHAYQQVLGQMEWRR